MNLYHLYFFKGCVHYIFTSLFFQSNREHLWNLEKKFISLQKLFSFARKSNFWILDIQIYDVIKCLKIKMHETRNTFYWTTWEVNTISWWNLASLWHITKEKNSSKNSTITGKLDVKTRSRFFCAYKESNTTSIVKWNFWSKLLMLDSISKTTKICSNHHADLLRFLFTEDPLKTESSTPNFSYTFLTQKFGFIILHELAIFH